LDGAAQTAGSGDHVLELGREDVWEEFPAFTRFSTECLHHGRSMTVRFHLLDALDAIPEPLKGHVMHELEAANERIAQLVQLDRLDIVVTPGDFVIPELGLNGLAHSPGLITVTLDPECPRMSDPERPTRILGMLAHEMHHVMRMRCGAWAYSLGERLVGEGLAQCFEEEVGAPTPFYVVALDDRTMKKMAARARPLLSATDYDHNAWMFGRRNDPEWPRNTGYSLGYALVKAWLAERNMSAIAAAGVPASEITEDWMSGRLSVFAASG